MSTSLTWPSTIMNPSYPYGEEYEDNSIKSKYEDGAVQSRLKFTRSRDTYDLKWDKLPTAQMLVMKDFIKNSAKMGANTFLWTNPVTEETKEVRIMSVIKPQLTAFGIWSAEISIQEV